MKDTRRAEEISSPEPSAISQNMTDKLETGIPEIDSEVQDRPAVLKTEDRYSEYRSLCSMTEEVEIGKLEHFESIPDYIMPTSAENPIVVKTPKGFFCIDGWNLVKKARENGIDSIMADIDLMKGHSDDELCFRKLAARAKSRPSTLGGKATYMELCRNTREMSERLLKSNEDLRVFSHGGNRRLMGFTDDPTRDVKYILSLRQGKDRNTINDHLRHSLYLSPEMIQFFNEKRVKEDFFNKVQDRKDEAIVRMKEDGRSSKEITGQVSEMMRAEYESYIKELEGRKTGLNPELKNISTDGSGSGVDIYSTKQMIRDAIREVSGRLSTSISDRATIKDLEKSVNSELKAISDLSEIIRQLRENLASS
jgi:hypothetical protein